MTKTIRLSGIQGAGSVTLVDSSDFRALNRWKWHMTSRGYAARSTKINGKQTLLLMHRAILEATEGDEIDHINRNPLDNRRQNLRFCTHKENMNNRNSTGSISWHGLRRLWQVRVQRQHKRYSLGYFKNRELAEKKLAQSLLQYNRT